MIIEYDDEDYVDLDWCDGPIRSVLPCGTVSDGTTTERMVQIRSTNIHGNLVELRLRRSELQQLLDYADGKPVQDYQDVWHSWDNW